MRPTTRRNLLTLIVMVGIVMFSVLAYSSTLFIDNDLFVRRKATTPPAAGTLMFGTDTVLFGTDTVVFGSP